MLKDHVYHDYSLFNFNHRGFVHRILRGIEGDQSLMHEPLKCQNLVLNKGSADSYTYFIIHFPWIELEWK